MTLQPGAGARTCASVSTTTAQTDIAGQALETLRNVESSAACFRGCLAYTYSGAACNTSAFRPSNGDCVLYAETIASARPSSQRLFVSSCSSAITTGVPRAIAARPR